MTSSQDDAFEIAADNAVLEPVGSVSDDSAAPEPTESVPPAPVPEAETAAETAAPSIGVDPVGAAPEYVGQKTSSSAERQTSPSTMAADVPDVPENEDPFFAVVRALVGSDTLRDWLLRYDGPDGELRAALCADLSISRDAFLAQASRIALSFSEEELDGVFPETGPAVADQ